MVDEDNVVIVDVEEKIQLLAIFLRIVALFLKCMLNHEKNYDIWKFIKD